MSTIRQNGFKLVGKIRYRIEIHQFFDYWDFDDLGIMDAMQVTSLNQGIIPLNLCRLDDLTENRGSSHFWRGRLVTVLSS